MLRVFTIFLLCALALPVAMVSAQSLGNACIDPPNCTFNDLITLAQNIINFLILVSIPAAAIAFAWAGFLFMTAKGSESQISQAKGIFVKVLIGFLFVLSGWLIVRTITSVLLDEGAYWNPLAVVTIASLADVDTIKT